MTLVGRPLLHFFLRSLLLVKNMSIFLACHEADRDTCMVWLAQGRSLPAVVLEEERIRKELHIKLAEFMWNDREYVDTNTNWEIWQCDPASIRGIIKASWARYWLASSLLSDEAEAKKKEAIETMLIENTPSFFFLQAVTCLVALCFARTCQHREVFYLFAISLQEFQAYPSEVNTHHHIDLQYAACMAFFTRKHTEVGFCGLCSQFQFI
jgi:hypothetical protein